MYVLEALYMGLKVPLGVSLGTCDPNRTVWVRRILDLGLS